MRYLRELVLPDPAMKVILEDYFIGSLRFGSLPDVRCRRQKFTDLCSANATTSDQSVRSISNTQEALPLAKVALEAQSSNCHIRSIARLVSTHLDAGCNRLTMSCTSGERSM